MTSKIEGISAETVDAKYCYDKYVTSIGEFSAGCVGNLAVAIIEAIMLLPANTPREDQGEIAARAAITTLLASGEVEIVQKQDEVEHYESCECCGNFHRMEQERDALQKFKDFVHKRLDDAGVPTHPEGEHSQRGCRIGDRLDIILTEDVVLRKDVEELVQKLKSLRPTGPSFDAEDWSRWHALNEAIEALTRFTDTEK